MNQGRCILASKTELTSLSLHPLPRPRKEKPLRLSTEKDFPKRTDMQYWGFNEKGHSILDAMLLLPFLVKVTNPKLVDTNSAE